MELTDSLRPIFSLQRTFRLSIVTIDHGSVQIARLNLLFTIAALSILSTYYIGVCAYAFYNFEIISSANPIDQGSFTTTVIAVPMILTIICICALFILTLTLYNRDLSFLQCLIKIDEILSTFIQFEQIYRSVRNKSICIFAVGYLYIFAITLLHLWAVTMFNNYYLYAIVVSFDFILLTFHAHTTIFIATVIVINDRLKAISQSVPNIKTLHSFMQLSEAEKLITHAIGLMNSTVCFKQAFVVMNCWSQAVSQFYMALLHLVFWKEGSLMILAATGVGVVPTLLITISSSYFGEKLELSVSNKEFSVPT